MRRNRNSCLSTATSGGGLFAVRISSESVFFHTYDVLFTRHSDWIWANMTGTKKNVFKKGLPRLTEFRFTEMFSREFHALIGWEGLEKKETFDHFRTEVFYRTRNVISTFIYNCRLLQDIYLWLYYPPPCIIHSSPLDYLSPSPPRMVDRQRYVIIHLRWCKSCHLTRYPHPHSLCPYLFLQDLWIV